LKLFEVQCASWRLYPSYQVRGGGSCWLYIEKEIGRWQGEGFGAAEYPQRVQW
jgi:hypothetical protein